MANIRMKVCAFVIPNFIILDQPPARREDGLKPSVTIPLEEVDESTLSELCHEFRANVFAKVKKKDPAKP